MGLRVGSDIKALIVLWVTLLVGLFRPELHGFDTVAYYSWVRALVIQGNLDPTETFARYGYLEAREVSPTGYRVNEWPVGVALLWLPFFLAAHVVALAARAAGIPVAADGFSPPYLVLTGLGSAVYGLAGMLLVRRLALSVAGPVAAFWAALGSWLGSPLVFYMSAHPFMSHAADFFVNALFLNCWSEVAGPANWRGRFRLGLVGGFAASVRYQNASLILWPTLADLWLMRSAFRPGLYRLGALAAGALVGFLPQLVVWRAVFGSWVVLNPYGAAGAGGFDLRSPHLLDVLLSTDRGLFPWAPLSVAGLLGVGGWLMRRHPALGRLVGAQFVAQVYIVGSWSSWSGAAAFGPRLLVGLFPGLGVGLAAFYEAAGRRWGWKLPGLVGAASAAWNLVLLARYGLGDIARAGPVPAEQLWVGQFTFLFTLGGRLEALLQALFRSGP
jgi:hypothetical protein